MTLGKIPVAMQQIDELCRCSAPKAARAAPYSITQNMDAMRIHLPATRPSSGSA
jgi:hypothetical protein